MKFCKFFKFLIDGFNKKIFGIYMKGGFFLLFNLAIVEENENLWKSESLYTKRNGKFKFGLSI